MPHNAAAMRSHCGGVLRMFILTGESFYLIVLHLRYLGHEGVARQAGTYDRTGAAFSLITRHGINGAGCVSERGQFSHARHLSFLSLTILFFALSTNFLLVATKYDDEINSSSWGCGEGCSCGEVSWCVGKPLWSRTNAFTLCGVHCDREVCSSVGHGAG